MSPSHAQHGVPRASASTENDGRKFSAIRRPTAVAASMNDAAAIRAALVESIKGCSKSRQAIAEEMSLLAGTEVTLRRLNAFTAESREDFKFPAELVRAFCVATGSNRLLEVQAELAGVRVITESEYRLLKLGREYLRQKEASKQISLLEQELAGVNL